MAIFLGANRAGCGLHELSIPTLESRDALEVPLLVRVLYLRGGGSSALRLLHLHLRGGGPLQLRDGSALHED